MKNVKLQNTTGVTKELKVGFSWTVFFFGAWVSMFRGEWSEFAKWVFLNPITLGIWGICQCWNANKKTIISYLEKGYTPVTDMDKQTLMNKGILS
ncbi:HrgC protein [Neobacillus niacini]|uniref:HrgC protein n=1 Tax=Neobacillus niacini TaxID=86668 RepID=UPI002FFE0B9D